MILKKQVYKVDRKVNPLIGILLFFISIILLIFTLPLGFVYGLFHGMFKKGIVGLSEYLLKIAISIDQLGNVGMQHLLNLVWIKKGGYKFGNRDETISSALGRNHKLGTLTKFGTAIDQLLDFIDKNHSLNSIDYYIEPSSEIIDQLAWIHVADQKLLAIKPKGKTNFILPGGQKEPKESDVMTLSREIKDELGIILDISSFEHLGIFEARANGRKPNILIRSTCYSSEYTGELKVNPEVGEIFWLNYVDRESVSEVDSLIFDILKDSGLLA
ncbi:NUDIX domain-containing protein [Arenibacter sp. BSSL-BM3]|uniref:NUDIX domain-containing protein n=1 Tax=Arenibacter arenosicollis TaxID=2762274 RepID=A0ABR7QIN5_9FLAO|nr:NUDIX domain-containing protein [Arenibacter arenosicollis]MBC8767035.1 NUDIX domain-containing protein [Arenibacter arenosicollis]